MKLQELQEVYDVVVIGGGPAGMMAAGRAAEVLAKKPGGGSVLLLEKNQQLGKKLLITGGGRCNLTNESLDEKSSGEKGAPSNRVFLDQIKGQGKFLFSSFSQHGVADSLKFFHGRKVKTKVENEGRVFPVSDQARTVYDALVSYMKDGKVKIATDIKATGFHVMDGEIVGLNVDVTTPGGSVSKSTVVGKSYILATGGTSHPDTGSTGEGFDWLRKMGHTVIGADVALAPIKIREPWVRELAGVSHQHVGLSIVINGKKQDQHVGRMVFAHFGMSGPLVLNMSKDVREVMQYAQPTDKIELSFDLMPDIKTEKDVDLAVQEIFKKNQNKKLKNAIAELSSPAMAPGIFAACKIVADKIADKTAGEKSSDGKIVLDPEKEVNLVTRAERLLIVKTIKDMRMTPTGFAETDKSIVASGGVKLEEVNFRTMQSRLFPNLYLVGDVLDIDRPSGGYSLQLCWTTGWVAGNSAGNSTGNDASSALEQAAA